MSNNIFGGDTGIDADFDTGEYPDDVDNCIMCEELFMMGNTGNELGFCCKCQEDPGFPYDLDAYYKDHDTGKVAFKGFDTMSRGILERYLK